MDHATQPSPTTWRRILSGYFRGRAHDGWWTVVYFMSKEAAARFLPFSLALSVALLETQDPEWKWKLAVIIGAQILFLLWNIPGHVLYIRHLSRACRDHGVALRMEVCRHLQQLSLIQHGRQSSGKIHSKIIRDIDNIESFPIQLAQPILGAIATAAVAGATIAYQAPIVAPVFLLLTPLAWGVHIVFKKKMERSATAYRETTERLSSRIEDMLDMIPVTRAHGLEDAELATATERIGDVRREAGRFDLVTAAFSATSWSTITIFNSLFLAAMIAFGFQGWLSVAEVVLFSTLFGHLTFAAMMVLGIVPQLVRLRDSYSSVLDLLATPDLERAGGSPVERVAGSVVLDRVTYTYPAASQPALENICLDVREGETIAIVGPSGGGKSTLLSAVLGFIAPEHGSVVLDGTNAQQLDMRSWRRQIAVVTQSSMFFSGTVRENIAHGLAAGDGRTADQRLAHALQLAGADGFVGELKEGLETRMGEDGRTFSGGQLQRLALARALVRDPRVLVLDEPTSALDAEAELAFREALERARVGRTVLLVSHSLLNARSADRIAVVERGTITALGTHDELLQSDNFYSRTYRKLAG